MSITHAKVASDPQTPRLTDTDWSAAHSNPTLAEVLVAGNITGPEGTTIAGAAATYASPASIDLSDGGVVLQAGDGINDGSNEAGQSVDIRGGATSPVGGFSSTGARLVIEGGGYDALLSGGGFRFITAGGGSDGSSWNGGDVTFQLGGAGGAGRSGLVFLSLPTSDPGVSGALWNDAGTVKVS